MQAISDPHSQATCLSVSDNVYVSVCPHLGYSHCSSREPRHVAYRLVNLLTYLLSLDCYHLMIWALEISFDLCPNIYMPLPWHKSRDEGSL